MRFPFFVLPFFIFSFLAIATEQPMPVTTREYAEFLNAVAATDAHTLYHETMNQITRVGEPGDYQYEARPGAENLPITFVTWLDAARYCNWKEHGSPAYKEVTVATTETGSYTIDDSMNSSVPKNENAHYFLPTDEEEIPSSLLADSSFYYWGANSKQSDPGEFVPLFHHHATKISTVEVSNPTLTASGVGFYLVEKVEGDQFHAASFLQASQPDDGAWSTLDEVIGVVGVLGFLGSGGGYGYYRYHSSEDGARSVIVTDPTATNRRREELQETNRDRTGQESEAVRGQESDIIDDVTGKVTKIEDFAPDQRSLVKKWADWLRNRGHFNSIYPEVDDIECLDSDDFDGDYNWIKPENRSCLQKIAYWMTQSFYPYKNRDEFLKKNEHHPQTLKLKLNDSEQELERLRGIVTRHEETHAAHQEAIEALQSNIAEHEETHAAHQETIEALQATIQQLQNRPESELRNREERLQFYEKQKARVEGLKDLLEQGRELEHRLITATPNFPATMATHPTEVANQTSSQQNITPVKKKPSTSSVNSTPSSLSGYYTPLADPAETTTHPLLKVAEVTKDYLILKFMHSQEQEASLPLDTSDQFHEKLDEIWKAYIHLVSIRNLLLSKKDLLASDLSIFGSSYVAYCSEHRLSEVEKRIVSIQQKLTDLPESLLVYIRKVNATWENAQAEFSEDAHSIVDRDHTNRSKTLSATPDSAQKAKRASVLRGLIKAAKKIISPAKNTPAQAQESPAATESKIPDPLQALERKIEESFSTNVFPIINQVNELHRNTYQRLHLAERNFLKAHDLIELYQADQGKLVMTTSSLLRNLNEKLASARRQVADVNDLVGQIEVELGGVWQQEKALLGQETYAYRGGGWRGLDLEDALHRAIENFVGYQQQINSILLNTEQGAIHQAQELGRVLNTAQEKAALFLRGLEESRQNENDLTRTNFLEAMESLLNFSETTTSLQSPSPENQELHARSAHK